MKKALLFYMAAHAVWAASVCQPCHPKQTEAYQRSPMGEAIGAPGALSPASFSHKTSGTSFAIVSRNGHASHRIERQGLQAEYPLAYRIGSGNHATGFLVRIGEWLFQSPAAHYDRLKQWDVAPGYEAMSHPDFNRRVTAECLGCHSSGTPDALQPISCDQCHGSPTQHLLKPTRSNITNPARLTAAARDAVCEQCHLNGEARITNPAGTTPSHAIVVFDRPRSDLRVVSHVEQLALSACARQSEGHLWCGSCHQPHGATVDINAQCRNCHATKMPASHVTRTDCIQCHMPKRDASDGGHTAFTDHRIQRQADAGATSTTPAQLRLWRDVSSVDLRERNLGLASILVGERDGSAGLINDGYRRLAAVFPKYPRDPDVLSSLGMVLFLKDQKQDARKLLEAAVQERPNDAELHEKLGLIRRANADIPAAIRSFEKSIALDAGRESAYFFLADCQPTPAARAAVLNRLLAVFPQSLIGREALRNSPRP
jgi:hypothetical protein